MTKEMYEDLLERNKLQISELNTLTEEQDRHIVELEKENAELKEQVENRNCSNCRRSKAGCPNDGSCHNFVLWQPFINPELTKAKELIGELISSLSAVGERGEEECELLNRAEQFLNSEVE